MEVIAIAQLIEFLPAQVLVVLAFIGTLHLALPPIQKVIEAVVALTPSKKDDEIYTKAVSSKYYVIFCNVVKYLSGLNLQKKKK